MLVWHSSYKALMVMEVAWIAVDVTTTEKGVGIIVTEAHILRLHQLLQGPIPQT